MRGLSKAAERVGQAIVDLRRNPYNRAIQRKIYSVGDHELTPVQVDLLETIMAKPGQQMNALAQALGVKASTVSRTILPLIELGLVERRAAPGDRRQARLFPTEIGKKQAATLARSRRAMMRAVQRHFSDAQLEHFADLLEQYLRALTEEGADLVDPARP